MSSFSQGSRYEDFLLRRDTADDGAVMVHERTQQIFVFWKGVAFQYRSIWIQHSDFTCNLLGRCWMVTCHHRNANSGRTARRDCGRDTGSRRVLDSDKTEQGKFFFQFFGFSGCGFWSDVSRCHRNHVKTTLGQLC